MKEIEEWATRQIGSFCMQKSPNFPNEFIDFLLFKEELDSHQKDQWGNFEHTFSKRYWEKLLWSPCIDEWAKNNRPQNSSLWPVNKENNKPYSFAACLTHDVDHLSPSPTFKHKFREFNKAKDPFFSKKQKLQFSVKNLFKLFLNPSKSSYWIEKTLGRSLEIEKKCGVTASYFFTVYPVHPISCYDCLYSLSDPIFYRQKKMQLKSLLREMIKEGFDVGLHGSYFSATVPGALKAQKTVLEEALAEEAITTRQHYLHWEFPNTLRFQEEAGFKIDSTLGFNRNIGYRAATGLPFKLFDAEKRKESTLYELPLILQDGAMLGKNALELSAEKMLETMKSFIDNTAKNGSCLTLLFHPDLFENDEIANAYQEAILYMKSLGGWVTNMKEVYKWWDK